MVGSSSHHENKHGTSLLCNETVRAIVKSANEAGPFGWISLKEEEHVSALFIEASISSSAVSDGEL